MNKTAAGHPQLAKPAFLALSCVGAFVTAPAFAGDAPASGPPPPPANDAEDRDHDILVTGVRRAEDPKQTAPIVNNPRSIVVVPQEVIEQTGSASLADALRTVPGVTFGAAEGGNPIGDRPFIRGFDSQGSIYLDGVRDFSAQTREVFAVDSIQVVRGSDSTLGGRGSAGGTINVVSKLPQLRNFAVGNISLGNAEYRRATADLNVQLTPTIAARIEGLYHDQDVAGRNAIYQRRWGVAPSIAIGLGTPTRLTLSGYYLEGHELPDSGLPFLYTIANSPLGTTTTYPALGRVTLANGQSGFVDRSTFYGLRDRDFRDTSVTQVTMRAEHDFGGVTLRNTARFTHNTQAYIFLLPDDSTGNVFGTTTVNTGANLTSGGYVWRRGNTRYGYSDALTDQIDLYGHVTTGGIRHDFSAGLEFDWEKARRGQFVTRGFLGTNGFETLSTGSTITPRCNTTTVARYYCTSLFNPSPSDPWVNYASDTSTTPAAISRYLPIEETQNEARTQSAYAFDSITLAPWLIVNLGARYDHFTSVVQPGQVPTATRTIRFERTDDLFNWQAGVVVKPTPNTSIYASYATSAVPPNSLLGEGQELNAVPTTDTGANRAIFDLLRVERTRSYEVGAKADLLNHQLNLSLALFQTDTDNARVTGDDGLPQFIGRRRIRGVELGVNGRILPGWTVFGGYTHLDPVIVDGGFTTLTAAAVPGQAAKTVNVVSVNTGRQAPQTARDSATVWTTIEPIHGLQIGGGIFYTSLQYGGYADNRTATQNAAGVVTVAPATRVLERAIPGYTRFDARIAYEFNHHLELSVTGQNLTDKVYFSQVYTTHYATIAPGRTVFGTLTLRYR